MSFQFFNCYTTIIDFSHELRAGLLFGFVCRRERNKKKKKNTGLVLYLQSTVCTTYRRRCTRRYILLFVTFSGENGFTSEIEYCSTTCRTSSQYSLPPRELLEMCAASYLLSFFPPPLNHIWLKFVIINSNINIKWGMYSFFFDELYFTVRKIVFNLAAKLYCCQQKI